MALPQTMGRYLARPADWTVEKATSGQKLLQFVCRYHLLHLWNGEGWTDVQGQMLSIIGYHYLMKADGTANEKTIEKLCAALGWDGRSFGSLAQGSWGEADVQLTIDQEEYEGKWTTKVKWIDTADSDPNGPSLKKAAPDIIKSFDAQFGAALRAVAGPAPSRTAPPTNGNGSGNTLGPIETAKRAAWEAYKIAWDKYVTDNPGTDGGEKAERWKEIVAEVAKGRDVAKLLAVDWTAVQGVIAKGLRAPVAAPFSDDGPPEFTSDQIPF
jgi:hypothetical protein